MPNKNKKIPAVFYKTVKENEPVREWLLSLGKKDRLIIGSDLKTVEYGWPIGMPTCRTMGNGLHEVRSNISNKKIARVLFFVFKNKMVLLHGFIKKSQKTPKPDLEIAIKRKNEVENG